ncbi:MAG TPA: hypothetical protein VHK69_00750 [Chitinophagaceae bacterium]|jgi:hypothetical protein|nr:hypothetical protein [Chitinophagaceae bacterium]
MEDRNQQTGNPSGQPNELDNRHHGPQGIDKAPGEETPGDTENFVAETQKGKQQVDADLDKESDRAIDQND